MSFSIRGLVKKLRDLWTPKPDVVAEVRACLEGYVDIHTQVLADVQAFAAAGFREGTPQQAFLLACDAKVRTKLGVCPCHDHAEVPKQQITGALETFNRQVARDLPMPAQAAQQIQTLEEVSADLCPFRTAHLDLCGGFPLANDYIDSFGKAALILRTVSQGTSLQAGAWPRPQSLAASPKVA